LKAALDHAFGEPPFRKTKAVVVAHDGKVIAEHYADGIGVDTPLLGRTAYNINPRNVSSSRVGPTPIPNWQ